MSAASPVLVCLDRWLLGVPGPREARLFATSEGVPRRIIVSLFEADNMVAQHTAIIGETALTRALDIAEEQS